MSNAARRNDKTEHEGTITAGSPNVTINGQPAARFSDYHACTADTDGYKHVGGPIVEGSASVTINGKMAARRGDGLTCLGPSTNDEKNDGTEKDSKEKDKVTVKHERKTQKGKIIDEDKEGKFGSNKIDGRRGPKKYQKKPLLKFAGQLVHDGDSATYGKFWGEHGKVLTGEYHIKSQADVEIRAINDFRAQIDVIDIGASGSVAQAESDEADVGIGKVKVSGDFLKAKADAKLGLHIDTKKKQAFVGAEGELGGSVLEGKVSGTTDQWKIPFTDWGIRFEGEASGSILTAKAAGHYGARYDPKKGFSLRAGGKVGLAIFGGGLGFGINIGPMEPPQIPRDKIVMGSHNVIIGN